MNISTIAPATLDDLYRVVGKAELIGGRIVHYVASGLKPNRIAFKIAMQLEIDTTDRGVGVALTDGIGFALRPPLANGRQSFSPDASFHDGPLPTNDMRFVEGAPTFAVEVRGEGDSGPAAEVAMRAKRSDYFEAGTLVVWDVDPQTQTVASYRGDAIRPVAVSRPGDQAEAEPAVPGWRVPVADLFH